MPQNNKFTHPSGSASQANVQIYQTDNQTENTDRQTTDDKLRMWVKTLKRENPNLSLRAIADIIYEQTGIKIGKDKVNSILQNP